MKNLQKLFLIVLISTAVFAQETTKKEIEKIPNTLSFMVIGDWGRNGDFLQRETAVALNNVVPKVGGSFVISTGDNFYESGVASIDDPLWMSSFENIYTGGYLLSDWYPVLGNHDYKGSVQAQIDYSKKSRRWVMPAKWYSFEKKLPKSDEKVCFIFLDTNPYEKEHYSSDSYKHKMIPQDTIDQKIWLDSVLTNTKAKWKIVVGHHPLYTGGMRKENFPSVRYSLHDIFVKHKVDAYFAGHEHDLQVLKPEGYYQFVSGAGSALRKTGSIAITEFSESVNGFMAVSLAADALTVQVINYKGELLHTTVHKK